ncbi:MAG: HIT domain-containing protein [Candidatus Babeliaceae bacterium]
MKNLYAPWRGTYIADNMHDLSNNSCAFCAQLEEHTDAKNFILKRCAYNAIFLNIYPYNPGHLLIVPYNHCDNLSLLVQEARAEMMEIISHSVTLLNEHVHTEGTNIGFNLGGKAAGGSIPEHIHAHVLPRWIGDTSFLPALAHAKPISLDLQDIYKKLLPVFAATSW